MHNKELYIRERKYDECSNHSINFEKKQMWENLMGAGFVNDLLKKNTHIVAYMEEREWNDCDAMVEYNEKKQKRRDEFEKIIEIILKDDEEFFKKIEKNIDVIAEILEVKVRKLCSQKFLEAYVTQILKEMRTISVRTVISEMHKEMQEMRIQNKNYDFFVYEYLGKQEYRKAFFAQYPVLERCLMECIERNKAFLREILERIERDKNIIEKNIFDGEGFKQIVGKKTNSDAHLAGRKVLQLKLDNGQSIIYKPHSIESEKWFGEFLVFLGKKCDIEMYVPKIVACEGYGWIEYIEQCDCKNYEELKRYYYRFGICLFVTYLFGISDIHCENLIAMGEYPIIIDLESIGAVFPNNTYNTMNIELQKSVLSSGMLPYYYWTKNGRGIDLSALSGGNNEEIPFKIPVVKNLGTVEMYIDYEYVKMKKKQNHAMLKGKFISPDNFEKQIIKGFNSAFYYTIEHREIIKLWVDKIKRIKSRHLVGDTQKYSMILSSSYHPMIMKDGADREFFLYSLWKGKELESKLEYKVVEGEIYDLLNNDIPYFYFFMDEPNLYDSRGNKILNYFEMMPIEYVYKRLESINKHDLKRQEVFIHLCLSAAGEEVFENKYKEMRKMIREPSKFSDMDLLHMVENIADKFLKDCGYEIHENSIEWFCLMVKGQKCGAINIYPHGMYLYDGLAGILLFFHILCMKSPKEIYVKTCRILEKQLFMYTDIVNKSYNNNVQSKHSGIYNGEGAIVYTYLMLFWFSKKSKYIEYAEKHAEVLMTIAIKDTYCDLVEGKAGAILVFCYMYLSSHKQKYLNIALNIAEKLTCEAINIVEGEIAWNQVDGSRPLLGMAHGNAGIIIALSTLGEITKNKKYYKFMRMALLYEHNNFNFQTGDWFDFRKKSNEENYLKMDSVAWCHGAGGILLSRLILTKMGIEQVENERISEDIKRAISFIKKNKFRKDMCLCHGECGNLLIMKIYNEWKKEKYYDENIITDKWDNIVLTKEWYNPGLMNGYIGIGYYYLMQIADIPNYLFLNVELQTNNGKIGTNCERT